MENRPPQQETPRRPPTNSGRKPNGSGGSPTPPWLWLLLLGGFALIFWQFVPKTEVQVLYYPWFYEQVEARQYQEHHASRGRRSVASCGMQTTIKTRPHRRKQKVRKFITYAPSERRSSRSCKSLFSSTREEVGRGEETTDEKKATELVKIDPIPRQFGQ